MAPEGVVGMGAGLCAERGGCLVLLRKDAARERGVGFRVCPRVLRTSSCNPFSPCFSLVTLDGSVCAGRAGLIEPNEFRNQ